MEAKELEKRIQELVVEINKLKNEVNELKKEAYYQKWGYVHDNE